FASSAGGNGSCLVNANLLPSGAQLGLETPSLISVSRAASPPSMRITNTCDFPSPSPYPNVRVAVNTSRPSGSQYAPPSLVEPKVICLGSPPGVEGSVATRQRCVFCSCL